MPQSQDQDALGRFEVKVITTFEKECLDQVYQRVLWQAGFRDP
jgi:hypothetical protein